jgi:hypothetical protein
MNLEEFTTTELNAELARRQKIKEKAQQEAAELQKKKELNLNKYQFLSRLIGELECLQKPLSKKDEEVLEILSHIRIYMLAPYDTQYKNKHPMAYIRSKDKEVNDAIEEYFVAFARYVETNDPLIFSQRAHTLSAQSKQSKNHKIGLFILVLVAELALISASLLAIVLIMPTLMPVLPILLLGLVVDPIQFFPVLLFAAIPTVLFGFTICSLTGLASSLYDDIEQAVYYNQLIDRIDVFIAGELEHEHNPHNPLTLSEGLYEEKKTNKAAYTPAFWSYQDTASTEYSQEYEAFSPS